MDEHQAATILQVSLKPLFVHALPCHMYLKPPVSWISTREVGMSSSMDGPTYN